MSSSLSSGLRGSGRGRGGHGARSHHRNKSAAGSAQIQEALPQGPEALLRSKYGSKLALAKELFPDWADEDLLATIDEAHGDLDTAVTRISEGQAQQWASSTKARKPKRDSVDVTPVTTSSERGFGRGGSRGADRGSLRGGRGGGRGARGGRGGGPGHSRGGSRTNGVVENGYGNAYDSSADTTSSYTPANFTEPTPATDVEPWGETTEMGASGDDAAGWGDSTETTAAADSVGGSGTDSNKPQGAAESGWGRSNSVTAKSTPAAAIPGINKGKAPLKPSTRTIQPGTKFSWAQIARPVEPPKPITPTADTRPETPTLPPPVAQAEPQAINIPSDEQIQAAATAQNVDPWASTPAAATEPWESRPLAGVGEGWAETVLAADNERPVDKSALPPTGVDPAGPIEISGPPQQDAPPSAITANLEAQAAQQQPQKQMMSSVIGPPGLAKRQSHRGDAAVIIGNDQRSPAAAMEQASLQFGSLALFDGRDSAAEQSKPIEAAQQQQHGAYAQIAAQQMSQPEQRSFEQQMQEKVPTGGPMAQQPPGFPGPPGQQQQQSQQQPPYAGYQPFGGYQDPHSAYASSPYAQIGSENSYYGQQPSQQHQQPHQQSTTPLHSHQQSYSSAGQNQALPAAASQYQPFGPSQGEYGQATQQQQHTPGPEVQRAPQATYDYYAQYQQQAGYPRSSIPEDSSKAAAASPAAPSSQPASLPQAPYGGQLGAAQSQYAAQYGYYSHPALYASYYGGQQATPGAQQSYYGAQPQASYPQSAYSYPYAGYNAAPGRGAYGPPAAAGTFARAPAANGSTAQYQTPQQSYSPHGAPGQYASQSSQQQAGQMPGAPGRPDGHLQPQSSYKDFSY